MNVVDAINRSSDRHGDRLAFISGDEQVSFAGFEGRMNRLAHGLAAEGLAKGDRVGLIFGNTMAAIQSLWACFKIGVVPVVINPRHPVGEVTRQLQHSGARSVIVDDGFLDRVVDADVSIVTPRGSEGTQRLGDLMQRQPSSPPMVDIRADDELYQFYGSGTTGEPKCIVECHRRWMYVSSLYFYEFDVPIDMDDRAAHLAPVIHASGTMVLPHYMRGAANCLIETPSIEAFIETVERHGITRALLVPTLLARLVDSEQARNADLRSLRHVIYTASPMSEPLLRRCLDLLGPIFEQIYGFAEYGPITVLPRADHPPSAEAPWGEAAGTVGRPIRGTEVSLRDAEGQPVPPGRSGEIWARGPGVFPGYWRDPERTARTISRDGFVRGGDIAAFDTAGRLRLLGRTNDMIITGGYNVYPASIEAAVAEVPGISEHAVFGVPDPDWGERVVVAVVPERDDPALEERVIEHCRKTLPSYEVPKELIQYRELPRNPNGKVLYRELRAPFWQGQPKDIH
jgi:acyl-CoA synthetase (AMP-forming)/AMP-acid ligase II